MKKSIVPSVISKVAMMGLFALAGAALATAGVQPTDAPVQPLPKPLELTSSQFLLVYQMLSITIATMGASFIFFVLGRQNLSAKYQPAMLVSALVVAVACYHYFRIFNSWNEAYVLTDGVYRATGIPFNDAYRYADWILTVPLLLVETVAVLALASNVASGMIGRLVIAGFAMIVLGYPGEVSFDTGTRLLWGTLSTIPFVYIVYTLFVELGKSLVHQSERVQVLVRNLRLLLFASWGFYPIAYLLPIILGGLSASGIIAVQVGYTLADILAKAAFGTLIYFIAIEKMKADGNVRNGEVALASD